MSQAKSVAIFLLLTSCAESEFKGAVVSKSAPAQETPIIDAVEIPPAVPQTEDLVSAPGEVSLPSIADCSAADANIVKSAPVKLNFPSRSKCSFGFGVNLPAKDSTLTSMEATTRPIPVPKGATICGMHMESDAEAKFRYDDMLVMTLDKSNVLFASTVNLLKPEFVGPKPSDGIFQWDWLKVRGKTISEGLDYTGAPYCLNEKNCVIPETEATGPIKVSFDNADFAPISSHIFNKESLDLDLIVMGDNDSNDCMHSALDLSVTFDYIAGKE